MKNTMALKNQLILGFTLIALFLTAVGGLVSFYFTSKTVSELTMSNLNERVSVAEAAIKITHQESIESQNRLMDQFEPQFKKNLAVSSASKHKMSVVNQETQSKAEIEIPSWNYNGK